MLTCLFLGGCSHLCEMTFGERYFENNTSQLCCNLNIQYFLLSILKTVVLLNIFVETMIKKDQIFQSFHA